MYFDLIILMVVFLDGWERPWTISKIFLRRGGVPRVGGTGADVTQDGWPVWKLDAFEDDR